MQIKICSIPSLGLFSKHTCAWVLSSLILTNRIPICQSSFMLKDIISMLFHDMDFCIALSRILNQPVFGQSLWRYYQLYSNCLHTCTLLSYIIDQCFGGKSFIHCTAGAARGRLGQTARGTTTIMGVLYKKKKNLTECLLWLSSKSHLKDP